MKKSKMDKACRLVQVKSCTKKQLKAADAAQRDGFFDVNMSTKTFVDRKHKKEKHKKDLLSEEV